MPISIIWTTMISLQHWHVTQPSNYHSCFALVRAHLVNIIMIWPTRSVWFMRSSSTFAYSPLVSPPYYVNAYQLHPERPLSWVTITRCCFLVDPVCRWCMPQSQTGLCTHNWKYFGHESKQGTTFVALLASNRPSSKQSKLTSLTALRLADWLMKRLPSRCCHHHQWPRPPWSLILRQMVFHLIIRKAYCFLGNQRMSSNWEGLIHWKRSKSCKISEGVCR